MGRFAKAWPAAISLSCAFALKAVTARAAASATAHLRHMAIPFSHLFRVGSKMGNRRTDDRMQN
jgi:hypothetical protein